MDEKKKDSEWERGDLEFCCFIPTTAVEVLNVRLLGLIPVGSAASSSSNMLAAD